MREVDAWRMGTNAETSAEMAWSTEGVQKGVYVSSVAP